MEVQPPAQEPAEDPTEEELGPPEGPPPGEAGDGVAPDAPDAEESGAPLHEPGAVLEAPEPPAERAAGTDPHGSSGDMDLQFDSAGGAAANGGPVQNPLALRHERLQGTISKWVPNSGWGFVKSHLFEGEVGFKVESIMFECQSCEFKEGDLVEFDVQPDERGRPHAVSLKPLVGRKPSDCQGQRLRGYVRRFADRWGFLNASAFDGDLFVHRDNLLLSPEQMQDAMLPLRAGQSVEFDVSVDDRGRTVAKQITTSALLRPVEWIGRRLQGYIRSFQGAWGFINSDRFAGDLFVHRDSLLPQYQGLELSIGTLVEFDVERDHHKKGGKNRLVARQVAILNGQGQPATPPLFNYGGGGYGAQAAPQNPYQSGGVCYPGGPVSQQAPYPYPDPMAQYGMPHQGGHPYGMPQPGGHLPQPYPMPTQPHMGQAAPYPGAPMYGQPGQPYGVAPPQPQPYSVHPAAPVPSVGVLPVGVPGPDAVHDPLSSPTGGAEVPGAGEQPQFLLHICTHDWEPDQAGAGGQLSVRKGSLVNVSHRAAHGWVYAAKVEPGGETREPLAEGWVPQAVAKRVCLCRVIVDWPAEGSGTLGLNKGDLIAVSREAERGWVFGERISPNRPDLPVDGWLPKKVLEYIIV